MYTKDNNYQPWPVVRFDHGQIRTIFPNCSINELGGYAITVHKSQGMTMNKVTVSLRKSYESSQVYDALSRARSLYGLKVTALPEKNFGGQSPEVKEFLEYFC